MTKLQRLLSHRWRVPAERFRVRAEDGVGIEGSRLGDAGPERPALVAVHGLFGWHRKPRFARFCERLARWFTVFALDLRGHGRSEGVSSYGGLEIHDVEAVVRHARARGHDRVVTMGTSMGAISVVRHGGLIGGVDQVVAISSLASWGDHHAEHSRRAQAWRRMGLVTATDPGRRLVRTLGVRLPRDWKPPEAPLDVVAGISSTPLLIVHGTNDHLFGEEEARALFERAGEPKRLLLSASFGHAEDGFSPLFARRIARAVYEGWDMPWRG
jgi:pimeloyl-ACP methyl ester carboxylesterase